MLLLVLSGVNTEPPVKDDQGVWNTAIEIFENILIPELQLEVASLLRELQAKPPNKLKSKGKRRNDDIEESGQGIPRPKTVKSRNGSLLKLKEF